MAPIRILYDYSLARNPAGTGVFARGLLAGLRKLPDIDVVVAQAQPETMANLDVAQKSLPERIRNGIRHLRYYTDMLPRQARTARCDAILCPSSLTPLRGRIPCVVTLHDLAPVVVPETLDWMSRSYLRAMLAIATARARSICTVSQAVRDEILKHYPRLDPKRVFITHNGPNPDLLMSEPRPVPGLEDPFVLIVGTLEPRKNHITVLRALAEHVRRRPRTSLKLVLAGPLGWGYRPVLEAINQLHLNSRVIRLGSIDAGTLKWLYLRARALLFPSLYEGFGIPVLEAFSFECPVIAARIPPVVELAGKETAILLEPMDVASWESALDAVAAGDLNGALRSAGRARSQQFSWESCAERVLPAVQAALTDPRN